MKIVPHLQDIVGNEHRFKFVWCEHESLTSRFAEINYFYAYYSDAGMTYLVGPDWLDLFDVVITNARKPKFFYDTNR